MMIIVCETCRPCAEASDWKQRNTHGTLSYSRTQHRVQDHDCHLCKRELVSEDAHIFEASGTPDGAY